MTDKINCNECGSPNYVNYGHNVWRKNPLYKNDKTQPKRIKVQRYQCKDCGKIYENKESKQ